MANSSDNTAGTGGPSTASPIGELLRIAAPTVATMTSYTLMTFVDKWLVSHLGAVYVGAQGNGGLAAWVPQSIAMGTIQIVNTYVSQNNGAGRPDRGPAYAWNGVWLSLLWGIALIPYALFAMPTLFAAAGVDAAQASLAVEYGRVLVLGAGINIATRAISQFFYGMQRAGIVTIAGVVANIVNLVLSAVLVFGNGPVPEGLGPIGALVRWSGEVFNIAPMGIVGSALGTVIATCVEFMIPMALFLGAKMNAKYATRAAWRWSWPHVKDIVRTGWPGGLMMGNEMVCWGFFMVYLVSGFGPQHASAGWIAHQYMSMSFMPAVGISIAASSIVGKYMGAGLPLVARQRAWLAVRLGVIYMGTCGVLFVVFRTPLSDFFIAQGTSPEDRAELIRLAGHMLIAAAAFQIFDAGAMVLTGALRGAGDTFFPGAVTIVASWSVIVGGGLAITHFFPELKSIGAWIAAALYIFVLCFALVIRFVGGKWMEIKLLKESSTTASTDDATLVRCGQCGIDIAEQAGRECPECGSMVGVLGPQK